MASAVSLSFLTRSRVSLLLAVGLCTGCALVAAAAKAECSNLPPSALRVYTFATTTSIEIEPGGTSPGKTAQAPKGSMEPHPDLVIATEVTGHVSVDKATVARGEQFCATPDEVLIGLGPTKRLVRLPQAASRSTCVRDALTRHAERHVDAEEQAMRDYVAGTEQTFASALGGLKRAPATSPEDAHLAFIQGVQKLVDDATRELDRERREASARVDTPEELATLARSCGEALRDIVWPRRSI